jgi:hypothetical protein
MYDMGCNNCLQEIISGEDFYEDEAEGTKYHVNCKKAAIDRRDKAEARVAELQAELAAHRAAHRWRPVTEPPVVTMQYQVVVQHSRQQPTADHMAYYPSSGWTGTDVIFWRPIPPLPAPDANEEPTS